MSTEPSKTTHQSRASKPRDVPVALNRTFKDGTKKTKQIQFDIGRALRFAKLSELAYSVDPKREVDVEAAARAMRYETLAQFDAGDMHAAIFYNDEGVIVAFRGTHKTYDEMMRALNYDRAPSEFVGMVRKRYQEILLQPVKEGGLPLGKAIEAAVAEHYNGHPDAPPKLYFTGHSVGGALACLQAARMMGQGAMVEAVYTYGQPRVGDKAFAKAFESHDNLRDHMYRIVDSRDPVAARPGKYAPGVNQRPSADAKVMYKHCGLPVVIDAKTSSLEVKSSTKAIEAEMKMPSLISPAALSHRITSYVDELQKLKRKQAYSRGDIGARGA